MRTRGELGPTTMAIPVDTASRRRVLPVLTIGLALLLTSIAAIAWLRPDFIPLGSVDRRFDGLTRQLVAAVGSQRFSEARLSEPFSWGVVPSPTRSQASLAHPTVRIAALRIVEEAARQSGVRAHRALGLAYLALGDADKSVDAFEQATELDPEDLGTHTNLSAALFERWRKGGQAFDAVRALEETGFVLTRQPRSREAAFNQALLLEYLGPADPAVVVWRRYLERDSMSPWSSEARAHLNRLLQPRETATIASAPSEHADAAAIVRDNAPVAYNFIEYEFLPRWAASTLAGEDVDVSVADRFAEALKASGKDAYPAELMQAVRASRAWSAGRRQRLAEGIRDVFTWRHLIDDGGYQAAEGLGPRAAVALTEALVDPSEAEFEAAYSDVVANRIEKALARLASLGAHAQQRRYWRIAAKAERLRALSAMFATRVAEAQERYQDALTMAERSGDVELAALFHCFIGEAFELQGDMLSSWTHFAAALSALPQFRTTQQRFFSLNGAAVAAKDAGLYHAALVFAEALLAATRNWHNPEGQISGRLNAARALAELSIGDRGSAYLDEAAALLPTLVDRPQARERLAAEIAVRRSFSLMGQDDQAALRAADDAIAFFGTSVRIRLAELLLQRGRIHVRLGQTSAARQDWLRGIDIIEDQRPALHDELLRVSRTAALWDLYTELLAITRADSRAALEIAERAHARELLYSLNPNLSAQTASVENWQRTLADGRQAIVYAQLPSRLLIWRITASDVELTEQPLSVQQLRQRVNAFVGRLDAGASSPDATALARILLPRGLTYDRAKPLIIVPDGALHRVPFAALPVPGSGNRLVEAAIPIVTPSLRTFSLTSRSVHRATDERSIVAIGVGDPVPSQNVPRLPDAEGEAAAVAAVYRNHELIVGRSASKDVVLRAMVSNSVIHFAGHSLLNPLFPERSQLLLSGGEAIAAPEIAALTLQPGTIAVLGACDTALGRTFNGEGPMSLVRAFLSAGASAVVASLWAVRDDDATRLLRLLHSGLSAGGDLESSLATSQRQLIRDGYAPSAWAGFTVVGGNDPERTK